MDTPDESAAEKKRGTMNTAAERQARHERLRRLSAFESELRMALDSAQYEERGTEAYEGLRVVQRMLAGVPEDFLPGFHDAVALACAAKGGPDELRGRVGVALALVTVEMVEMGTVFDLRDEGAVLVREALRSMLPLLRGRQSGDPAVEAMRAAAPYVGIDPGWGPDEVPSVFSSRDVEA